MHAGRVSVCVWVCRSHGGSQGASQLEHFCWVGRGEKAADQAVRQYARQVFTTIVKIGTGV
jgi:hypothetical protein